MTDEELAEALMQRVDALTTANEALREDIEGLIRGNRRARIFAAVRFVVTFGLGAAGVPMFFAPDEEQGEDLEEIEQWRTDALEIVDEQLEDVDLPEGSAEVLRQAIIHAAEAQLRHGAG